MTFEQPSDESRQTFLTRTVVDSVFRGALQGDLSSALASVGIEPTSTLGTALQQDVDNALRDGVRRLRLDDGPPVSLDIAAARRTPAPRVGFVVLPWAETRWAAIGVSLLQATLAAADIDSDVLYPNLDFAESIGNVLYNHIGAASPKTALVGDWLFAEHTADDERYVKDVLLGEHSAFFDFATLHSLGEIRSLTAPFLDAIARHEVWQRYDIVGFTSTFQQNVAVLGLARRLKELYPHLTIIMGGGNCEGPMGPAILRNFPAIDYVFQGEPEPVLARFIHDLRAAADRPGWLDADPFWQSRADGLADGRAVITCGASANMDDLVVPTYEDFYARLRTRRPGSSLPAETAVPIETSRGCWWGEKKHCTFCGLNGLTMAFRSKSAQRAFDELVDLVHSYGLGPKRRTHILVVDNILDYRYFNDFLPMIAESDLKVVLHYEVKANLRLDQLMLLRDAGVHHLQPGIESMSNHLLEVMRKGTTRLRNLQTMKWCTELGIDVSWNYLHGFPGETDDDYVDLPELFGLVSHLPPPEHVGPARADRFSPFYESPEEFGIAELVHEMAYDHVYGEVSHADRAQLAYFFRLRASGSLASPDSLAAVTTAVAGWRRVHSDARLEARWVDGQLRVLDTRPARRRTQTAFVLDPDASNVLVAIDQLRSTSAVERVLSAPLSSSRITGILDDLVMSGLAVRDGDSYLGLPILDRRRLPTPPPGAVRGRELPLLTNAG